MFANETAAAPHFPAFNALTVAARMLPLTFREREVLVAPDDLRNSYKTQSLVAPIEERILGFTHAQSGRVIAELWKLPQEISEVIEFHHNPEAQTTDNELTLIVEAAYHFCWNSNLGYGYSLTEGAFGTTEGLLCTLGEKFPRAQSIRYPEYASVMDAHIAAAGELADRVFGLKPDGDQNRTPSSSVLTP
jgi:HDOD domain